MIYDIGYCSREIKSYSDTTDKCYLTWRNMLKRCYSTEKKYENYRKQGVKVCNEWLDYVVFKSWYDRNYYEIGTEKMSLDKDILNHGNKLYCPENCIFVPMLVNQLFVKNTGIRGNLPIGVYYDTHKRKYISCCSINGKNHRTEHKDADSAFTCYKAEKEKYIKEVAESYRGKIPDKLYNAMMMYEVREYD